MICRLRHGFGLLLCLFALPLFAQEETAEEAPAWSFEELTRPAPGEETLCLRQTSDDSGAYKEPPTGLLWRIHDPDGAYASYLMGTYHSGKPVVMDKMEKIKSILHEIDVVAVELLQSDPAVKQSLHRQMRLPQGQVLSSLIGEELFSRAITALKPYGITPDVAMGFQPWALAVTLNLPLEDLQAAEVLDARIERLGKESGKRLVGLETAEEQMAFFLSLTLEEQKQILDDAIRNQPKKEQWIQALLEKYLAEDTAGLMKISNELNKEAGDQALAERFTRALIDQRNRRMVRRMLPLIREGALLTAVGALHLPGEKGILHRLEKEGFCLEVVQ